MEDNVKEKNQRLRVTLLGTGTSGGVPSLGCQCEVCRSQNPRDKRMRCVAMVESESGTRVLIDWVRTSVSSLCRYLSSPSMLFS